MKLTITSEDGWKEREYGKMNIKASEFRSFVVQGSNCQVNGCDYTVNRMEDSFS